MTIVQRFRALPRAAQWGVWAAVAFIAYFVAVEPALERYAKISAEADSLESNLRDRASTAQRFESTGGELERAMVALGNPALPAKGNPLPALDRRVSSVLSAHNVVARKREPRAPIALLTGPGQRDPAFIGPLSGLQRVGIEITFESDTGQLAKILRDLEAAREVASIPRLSVRKAGDGKPGDQKLAVTMTVEAWSATQGELAPVTPTPDTAPPRAPSTEGAS
jgi:hypothetical protein